MLIKLITVFAMVNLVYGQKPSPCPEVFTYDTKTQEENRWFGTINIQSTETLEGVWLRIALDKRAELIGNWFSEAVSDDQIEFVIKKPGYRLEKGTLLPVRFFTKYSPASSIPSLQSIRLNGKIICNKGTEPEETTPKLHISQIITTRPTERPVNFNNNREQENSQENYNRPSRKPSNNNQGSTSNNVVEGNSQENISNNRRPPVRGQTSNNERDENVNSGTNSNGLSAGSSSKPVDYFPGDFALFSRPNPSRPSRPSVPGPNQKRVTCGTVASKASPLISFGQNTTQGQWPWHAALYYAEELQHLYTCGATLISEDYVITAAHCVTKPQSNRLINIKSLIVYLGKHNLKKFGSNSQEKEVSRIIVHPEYNFSMYFNDIAVLQLKTPAEFTTYVRPCCLWEGGDDNIEKIINKLGTVVGWGFDENRKISDDLMQAQMPIVSTVTCIYSNREFFSQFTFEKNYCAGFRNGTSVCNGDSGGGMVFPKSGTSGPSTVWQLRGIVSVGVALQGQGVCDTSHYIVFTDVAKHLDWIREVTRD